MTESTGGITMTPPGKYRDGTVGCALPGIEICRAEDGELLIRGPYVMDRYSETKRNRRTTGKLVSHRRHREARSGWLRHNRRSQEGHLQECKRTDDRTSTDRKSVSVIRRDSTGLFDRGWREYNTVLIYVNEDVTDRDSSRAGDRAKERRDTPSAGRSIPDDLREQLGNIIASVNGFLAPFERVSEFALLPRP